MFSITKVINNNVCQVVDPKLKEYVVFGKGIGFQAKQNDILKDEKIERKFSLFSHEKEYLISQLGDVDYELLSACEKIRKEVENTTSIEMSNYAYFSLIDHINTALYRVKYDIVIDSEISNEDLITFEKEYKLSRKVGKVLKEEIEIEFSDVELDLIALHFITAFYNNKFSVLNEQILRIIQDVLDLLNSQNYLLNTDEFSKQRFITHLKFLIIRHMNQTQDDNQTDTSLFNLLTNKYTKAYKALEDIKLMLEKKHNIIQSSNEQLYLLMHLAKLIK